MDAIHQILTRYWGFSRFRPLQEEIIHSVMEGRDTLALMPTGGGKSICFQVPAMAKEGICLVISPLIALMKDQVEFLNKQGIKAAMLHSYMSFREIALTLDNCIYGNFKFLYVSPERLANELFKAKVQAFNINLIAIDEAHCISQWGYDFRPSYLNIAQIRERIPAVPVLGLTASATQDVIKDIQEKLQFREENVMRSSFERKNLAYIVQKEDDKENRLLKITSHVKGSGIIYVKSRKRTEEVAAFLLGKGVSADFYHAGLNHEQRSQRQDNWLQERTRVMVATNAFGMGINKSNVRFVVHLDLPDTIESYFQESGRAGRDEKRAYCVLLFTNGDRMNLERRVELSFPPIEDIRKTYSALCNYYSLPPDTGKGISHDFSLHDFCFRYSLDSSTVLTCIKFLEREDYLMLSDAYYRPSQIHFILNHKDIYRFQIEHPEYDAFIKLILRSYEGVFNGYVNINEPELARRSALPEIHIRKLLQQLHAKEVISFLPETDKPQLVFLSDTVNPGDLRISKLNYHELKKRAVKRMEDVIHYATSGHKCRSQLLLAYFGETETTRCGICDVCIERNKLELSDLEFKAISDQIKIMLRQQPMPLNELVANIKEAPEDKIMRTLKWLFDNDKIQYKEGNKLNWIK